MKKLSLPALLAALLLAACASTSEQPQSHDAERDRAHRGYNELDAANGPPPPPNGSKGPPPRGSQTAAATGTQLAQSDLTYESASAAAQDLPKPVLMVLPDGNEPLETLRNNPFAKSLTEAGNEYLTQRGYDVKSLEGNEDLNDLISLQGEISDSEDPSYLAGLSLGADIYIKFSGTMNSDMVSVSVSAYETSTARLLGSQSSSTKDNGVGMENRHYLVQSALKKAMPGLESKILSYWSEDLRKGVQYKVVIHMGERFSGTSLEDLQEGAVETLRAKFGQVRINSMSDRSMDLIVYANPSAYTDAFAVYSGIREALSPLASAKKTNIVKKLILMDLE